MQIILQQDEIEIAIESYVRSQINIADGQKITIDFKAGRGDNPMTATLDIRAAGTPAKKVQTFRAVEPEPQSDGLGAKAMAASAVSRSVKATMPPVVVEELATMETEEPTADPDNIPDAPAASDEPSAEVPAESNDEPTPAPAAPPKKAGSIFNFAKPGA